MFSASTAPGIYLPVWVILVITRYEAGRYVSKLKVHWPFPGIEEFIRPHLHLFSVKKQCPALIFDVWNPKGTFRWIYLVFEMFQLGLGSLLCALVWVQVWTLDSQQMQCHKPGLPKKCHFSSGPGWVQPHSSLKCECLLSWVEQRPLPFLTPCDHFSGNARAKENRAFLLNSTFNFFFFSPSGMLGLVLWVSFLWGFIPVQFSSQELFQIERKVCRWIIYQWDEGERLKLLPWLMPEENLLQKMIWQILIPPWGS